MSRSSRIWSLCIVAIVVIAVGIVVALWLRQKNVLVHEVLKQPQGNLHFRIKRDEGLVYATVFEPSTNRSIQQTVAATDREAANTLGMPLVTENDLEQATIRIDRKKRQVVFRIGKTITTYDVAGHRMLDGE